MNNFIEITAKDNPLIKLVCALQTSAKSRKENNLFVLEGLRICMDAYDNSIKFDKLIVSKTAAVKYQKDIVVFSNNSKKCYLISDDLFKKISDTDSPQGIIAVCPLPNNDDIISAKGRYVALDNISDPTNLGAIARTAEALGINGIILTKSGCDPYSPKSLRCSMGTLLRIPLFITDDIISFAKSNGLRCFAGVVDADAQNIKDTTFADGDVLIIGNEANGISDYVKENSFKKITIKMQGSVESLNAAAAATIAMWEMKK